jgi:hypothetical protein
MTHQATTTDGGEPSAGRRDRLWSGIMGFGSFLLVILGGFHVFGGIVAFFVDDAYEVPRSELMVSVSYNVWGVVHIALGIGMIAAAVALISRTPWAQPAVIVLATVSAITNVAFLSAHPVWYSMMIVLDLLVIYAVTAHFDAGADFDY